MVLSLNFKKHKILFFILAFGLALLFFASVLQIVNYQKICQGVHLFGQDFSGLNFAAAKEKLNALAGEAAKKTLKIKYNDRFWDVLPEELGVNFDTAATYENLVRFGHNENLALDAWQQIKAIFIPKNINASLAQDWQKFNAFTEKNLSPFEIPAQNATLLYRPQTNDFVLVQAKDGLVFDRESVKQQIIQQLISTDKKPILIERIIQKPILKEDRNSMAASQAKNILRFAPFQIKYGGATWPIDKEVLVDWLEFLPYNEPNQTMAAKIREESVKEFLSQLAPGINREAVNAKLAFKDGKVIAFALSQTGRELNIDESAKKISYDIAEGKKEIALIVLEIEPQISTDTIDTFGLSSLLAIGTSIFSGSPKNRVHNIGIGSSKINGFLLKPGEEFSFISAIGEIEAAQGYLPELVIKDNKTVPEYGGGLCQLSTTLFRAAVNAGLKITERYPHAFPVKYYNPQGFDATIYPPHPDLRFINDTPANILIQSKINGNQITFEIYGTKDNREVKIDGPIILESNPSGSMKTILYQEIWRDGLLERRDTFRSNYKSPALYPIAKNPLE